MVVVVPQMVVLEQTQEQQQTLEMVETAVQQAGLLAE
jgi:hypothetical protein